jgi:hypothetical protein
VPGLGGFPIGYWGFYRMDKDAPYRESVT